MNDKELNDEFSIAVDKALLKLSTEYGIALPKDDPILMQLYLNKEIINSSLVPTLKNFTEENQKSKLFFRKALNTLVKNHNDNCMKIKNEQETFIKKLKIFAWFLISITAILVSSFALSFYLLFSKV